MGHLQCKKVPTMQPPYLGSLILSPLSCTWNRHSPLIHGTTFASLDSTLCMNKNNWQNNLTTAASACEALGAD